MNKISVNEMMDMLVPDLRNQRERLKGLNISHIILDDTLKPESNSVFGAYQFALEDICHGLNIRYTPVHTDRKFSSLRSTINRLNEDSSVHGILYDDPFKPNLGTDQLHIGISPIKDIECITPTSIGKYICNQNSIKTPCFLASLYELLFMHNIGRANRRMLVINNEFGAKNKFIHKNTTNDLITFTTTTPNDADYISTNIYNYDVIISTLFDTDAFIDNSIVDLQFEPKIVLDYGYCNKESKSSIDPKIFKEGTRYYNIFDGLLELYVINVLNNLCKSYK